MSGLAFACVVVMPPRPNGRMFPPRMKTGVLSVMFACQQHDAAQILRLAIKEVPSLLQWVDILPVSKSGVPLHLQTEVYT